MKKILLVIVLLFVLGCAQKKDFNYGVQQINSLNAKYSTTMETYPGSINKIDAMLNEFAELKKLKLDSGQEPFGYAVDYRMLNLEAEELFIQSQKYGNAGTTKNGFACKPRPLILESVAFRNSSAAKGFEAVDLLSQFIDRHPEEAGLINLSRKNALFLNATFYQISADAEFDSDIINNFCPENVTLDIYRQEFRRDNNLSEDSISKLSYKDAVVLWKNKWGIN